MDPEHLQQIVSSAVVAALQAQQTIVDRQVAELKSAVEALSVRQPVGERFEDCVIDRNIQCDEGLDIVKSIPEFTGVKKEYLTFRRAAETAYKVFQDFQGSARHYQATAIIRNKIKGAASDKLTGYGTALNFRAIISRLDSEYGDKRPIHLVEQEMSTLRQGGSTVAQFYDEVQQKLTLLMNKTLVEYQDKSFAQKLNRKYRRDALRVFISGLKRNLSDTLFSAQPKDLPSALALAEEMEWNKERYNFASSFSSNQESTTKGFLGKPPQPFPKREPSAPIVAGAIPKQLSQRTRQAPPEPMEVDPTIRNNLSQQKTWRSPQFRQGINTLSATEDGVESTYDNAVNNALEEVISDDEEYLNFLGISLCSRSSKE